MKKFLAVLILAVMVVSGVFADTAASVQTDYTMAEATKKTASADVTFDLNRADMYFYTFGFADTDMQKIGNTDIDDNPTWSAESLVLTYNKKDSTASNTENTLYFYYKARTEESFDVTFSIAGPMSDQTANGNPDVEWKVDIAYQDSIGGSPTAMSGNAETISSINYPDHVSDTTTGTVAYTEQSGEQRLYAAYAITATTDVIPLLDKDAKYKGTLNLTVSAT